MREGKSGAKVAERNEMRVSFNRVRNRMGQRERGDLVYRRYRTKLMGMEYMHNDDVMYCIKM